MKKYFIYSLLVIIIVQFTGCASIVSGKTADVHIRSNPPGAEVFVDEITRGTTPMMLKLKRKQRHTMKFVKEGYAEEMRMTRKGFNWWFVGNVIFGGIIGIIVDFATGAVYSVQPEEINVTLGEKTDSEANIVSDQSKTTETT